MTTSRPNASPTVNASSGSVMPSAYVPNTISVDMSLRFVAVPATTARNTAPADRPSTARPGVAR